ncbi:fimbrial protein [Orbus wheelerorum]|uniref:fimbrial protein n=1 Tax=Orbus wheelerorum TaxID=3074111 RepID=UPI00370D83EE
MRLFFYLFFILTIFPVYSYQCTYTTINSVINVPNPLIIPSNLMIGDLIGEYQGTAYTVSTCTDTSGITSDSFSIVATKDQTAISNIDGESIFKTSVDGIGYALGGTAVECSTTGWVSLTESKSNVLCSSRTGMIAPSYTIIPLIRLYKIGNISSTSMTITSNIGYAMRIVNDSNRFVSPMNTISSANVVVEACSITSSTIGVNMGSIPKNQFNGIGTAANNTQSFNIVLNCAESSSISLSINGNIYKASEGLLNLINSSAKGVAIQLLYNNKALPLNSNISVGNAQKGIFTIPLQARYYQISDIEAGTANSTVTFTVQYQ